MYFPVVGLYSENIHWPSEKSSLDLISGYKLRHFIVFSSFIVYAVIF